MIDELKLAKACGAKQLIFRDKTMFAIGSTDFKIAVPKEYRGIMGGVNLDWFLHAVGNNPTKIEGKDGNLVIQDGRFESSSALLPNNSLTDQLTELRISANDVVFELSEITKQGFLDCAEVTVGALSQKLKYVFLSDNSILACDNCYLRKRHSDLEIGGELEKGRTINLPVEQIPLKLILKYTDKIVFSENSVKCKMKKAICLLPFSFGDGDMKKLTTILESKGELFGESTNGFGLAVKRISQIVANEPVKLTFKEGGNLKISACNGHEKALASVVIPEVTCCVDFEGTCSAKHLARWADCHGKIYGAMEGRGLLVEHDMGQDLFALFTNS